jgi:hypothetical protein
MSRSAKKHPIHGVTAAESEKWDKRQAHKALRTQTRIHQRAILSEERPVPLLREVSDTWTFAKDGKRYSGRINRFAGGLWDRKWLRK